MNGIEQALLQIRSLKEQRKILKKQIQAREELISNLLEAGERMETWIRSNMNKE